MAGRTIAASVAERLNQGCHCVTLDSDKLAGRLNEAVGDSGFHAALAASHPGLVSRQPVFMTRADASGIAEAVKAIEAVVRLPTYRARVLANAPDIAQRDFGPAGVFMGYDFHLAAEGPRLIEINTNAGGALINAYVAAAHSACCRELDLLFRPRQQLRALEAIFVQSFRSEWARQGRTGPLTSIAIVDHAPREQYLYPEFLLFQQLFKAHGLRAFIAAPDVLSFSDGKLRLGGEAIDLVYNRSTDFMLADGESAALADAYRAGAVVVTPNPRAHALYANKSNLIVLSDAAALRGLGADEAAIGVLSRVIPRTEAVTADNAARLWKERDGLFFKPLAGFGSKGTYRGDKLTKRVWETIAAGGYVAQDLVVPSTRSVRLDGETVQLKLDLRAFTYDGEVLLMAARLYKGQTTNFRTPGGGFAPVFFSAADAECTCC